MQFTDIDWFVIILVGFVNLALLVFLFMRSLDQKHTYNDRHQLVQVCLQNSYGDLVSAEYMLLRTKTYYNSYFSFKILDWICNLTSVILAVYTLSSDNRIIAILSVIAVIFVIFLKFNERSRDYLRAWRRCDYIILDVITNLKICEDSSYTESTHEAIVRAKREFSEIESSITSDES